MWARRFHQRIKKHLAKSDPAISRKGLHRKLDRFVAFYNEVLPHGPLRRQTRAEVYGARAKSGPKNLLVAGAEAQILDTEGQRIRRLTVDPSVDYQAKP